MIEKTGNSRFAEYYLGRLRNHNTCVKRVGQDSSESRGLSPGSPVSSRRECSQGWLELALTLPNRSCAP